MRTDGHYFNLLSHLLWGVIEILVLIALNQRTSSPTYDRCDIIQGMEHTKQYGKTLLLFFSEMKSKVLQRCLKSGTAYEYSMLAKCARFL